MTVTTALYRRYRPDSFADVIGQEHVTEPLMTALRKNRVNHAYLFSGPRGCGKTTSARILARCLNCAEGPTDTPCGKCPSCIELARGGSGSLDVIEIDAASHGGVDDARDLRERATFAPIRDRYKIFIIDEAHMVTSAGFNALLKIVEEPPEHIKFIFATTEPDKVIGTIRSRTHHYPFRLVPPEPLLKYLEVLCQQENVPVAPGVLSLVIRAGGGSVRDTLSVLDQLMAGAGPNGLAYDLAVALLGYTDASLLDDVVDAIAAADAPTVFKAVDRVIQTGHDPRRFVEDLLERFRDLIIVQAMPESAQAILRGMPADQIARMRNQATNLGAAELSRAADVTNTALTEMTGATSPRLHLELLCARILLPSAEQTERGIAARIDRVERRLNYADDAGTPAAASSAPGAVAGSLTGAQAGAPTASAPAPVAAPASTPHPAAEPSPVQAQPALTAPRVSTSDWPVDDRPAPSRPVQAAPSQPSPAPTAPEHVAEPEAPAAPASTPAATTAPAPQPATAPAVSGAEGAGSAAGAGSAGGDVEVLRRAWPDVLQTLSKIKRSTWALVEPNAQVAQFDGQVLTLAFTTSGLAGAFGRADHSENLRQAIHKTIGIDCQIVAVAGGNSSASSEPNPKAPTSRPTAASPEAPAPIPSATQPVSAVDSAWGLAPAAPTAPAAPSVPAQATDPAPRDVTPLPAQAAPQESTPRGTTAVPAANAPIPPGVEASSKAAQSARHADGDYSQPDDDWGPPRDEDAPPMDEEPPADWEPPMEAAPPAGAFRGATDAPKTYPAPAAIPGDNPEIAASSTSRAAAPDISEDPWSRAVEQAPGTWVVGTDSNVGHAASRLSEGAGASAENLTSNGNPGEAENPGSSDAAAAYEPAAAQAPAAAPAQWPSLAGQPEEVRGSVATLEEGPPSSVPSGRQSLYQRLTNSPEAQAGRVQAPVRTQAPAATVTEDIPSPEDETIEESRVFGRAAVERILGGKLIEERALDGSPLQTR
ncbi:DNA polymerase III subunit gamma and tau [Arthrobacter sp. SIMBA_036]|uniref:DNA polymerase III subunit gamma and tau n=2 Tax=Bacillati TaxID=1783272 RepID=UPI0039785EDE